MFIYSILAFSTLLALLCLRQLAYAYRHFRIKDKYSPATNIDTMPSVSVCIPARNETASMTQCLEHVVASTYPKMEVIVLDDSSVDDTSILIKSFAHSGVRFVEGAPLKRGWLGKNHALNELLKQASGEYVLFVDVNTHIKPYTIAQLMAYIEQKHLDMISVLPERIDGTSRDTLLTTLRYWWPIILRRKNRPATSSTLWGIKRKLLQTDLRGFANNKESIQPEATIAREVKQHRTLLSDESLGVSHDKQYVPQLETARRLYYPLSGGKPHTALLSFVLLAVILSPVVILILTADIIALLVLVLWLFVYGFYLWRTRVRYRLAGIIFWPYIVLQDSILLAASCIGYARSTITWKGRPVKVK